MQTQKQKQNKTYAALFADEWMDGWSGISKNRIEWNGMLGYNGINKIVFIYLNCI